MRHVARGTQPGTFDPTSSAPVRMSRRPPSISGAEASSVLIEGAPVLIPPAVAFAGAPP
jgi:hypothetical protein